MLKRLRRLQRGPHALVLASRGAGGLKSLLQLSPDPVEHLTHCLNLCVFAISVRVLTPLAGRLARQLRASPSS
jgi:hypothetical protein